MSDEQNQTDPDNQQETQNQSGSSSQARRSKGGVQSSNGSSQQAPKKAVHWILQGKGGVGKSTIASLIAQHLMEAGEPVVCLDTDPVQHSLVAVEALKAEPVALLDDDHVNVAEMDAVIQRIVQEDAHFVIDNGAASFIPLSSYLLRDGVLDIIVEYGKRAVIHTVIVGGRALADTAGAFADLATQFPACAEIVVWTNPYFGDVNGFECSAIYQELSPRCAGLIKLPQLDPNYGGRCFSQLLASGKTLAQARAEDSDFTLMAKLRLANIWLPIREQLAAVI